MKLFAKKPLRRAEAIVQSSADGSGHGREPARPLRVEAKPRRLTLSIWIFGAGAQGIITLDVVRAMGRGEEAVFLDDNPARKGQVVDGVAIQGSLAEALTSRKGDEEAIVALGHPVVRMRIAAKLAEAGVRRFVAVHPSAVVFSSATLGQGTLIAAGAIVGSMAKVGEDCIVNSGALVEHDDVLDDGVQVAPRAILGGRVTVGRGSFVCMGATLLPRIKIGASSIVAAASVVTRDVGDGMLVAGTPARPVEKVDENFDWSRLL